jgi:hypothetical protein
MKKLIILAIFSILVFLISSLVCQVGTIGTLSAPTAIAPIIPLLNTPARWVEFERALASVLLSPPDNTLPDVSRDQGWCEWEFWGRDGGKVYAWAECAANNAIGTATSAPVIIYIGEDGHITSVVMPQEGWGNIESLFPQPVLTRILNQEFDAALAMDHINKRRIDPSIPPLIVEQGIEMPFR